MLREWAETLLELAKTPWGPLVLVAHAFLESFILPIAHDIFLVTVSLARPKMSLIFALMSTTASTLGNMVGYYIGKVGGTPLLEKVVKGKTVEVAKKMLHRYDAWATAIAAFTPFPDKVFSLVAGAFGLRFWKFVIVVFFARAARFYLISVLLFIYGESVREFLLDYLGIIMIGFLVLAVISSLTWKAFFRWFEKRLEQSSNNPGPDAS